MRLSPRLWLLAFAPALLPCAPALRADDPAWQSKPILEWDKGDANQVLSDSPWAKTVALEQVRNLSVFERRDGGNWDAGIGEGIGLTGLFSPEVEAEIMRVAREHSGPGNVRVRWESALPVRAAEQVVGDAGAPMWQGDYYAISVRAVRPPFKWNLENELKDLAFLKRDRKKDVKPARVAVFLQADGLATVVYLFPRSAEISTKDSNVRFTAQIGRLFVSQFFFPEEMEIEGQPQF